MSRRLLLVVGLVAIISSACAKPKPKVVPGPVPATQALLPAPSRVEPGSGAGFTLAPSTTIAYEGGDRAAPIAKYLSDLIGTVVSTVPPAVQAAAGDVAPSGQIYLALRGGAASGEGYELTVTPTSVVVTAAEPAGLFYGVQTLRQLLPWYIEYEAVRADKQRTVTIPAVHVVDAPRYAWRGAMLDVSRHFFTVDEVKRYIDLLSMLKMNRLHLHLADDQGWRIEIKSRPNLTAHAGGSEVGGGPGGFYTQEQYADLVAYAQSRFITIVPEIDMPGHTNAALASYPEITCNGVAPPLYTDIKVGFSAVCVEKEETYKFIDDVVREIAAMTPGPYFHAGGDEVKTLTPQQYAAFVERVQGIVQSHGKQMIGWDEVAATTLLPSSIVQLWRPKTPPGDAVLKGAKVILSPANHMYLDMKYDPGTAIGLNWAGLVTVRTAYDWEPEALLPGVTAASILGVEAPIWSETIANIRELEFLAFPRMAAVAEIGWTARAARTWESFRERLGAQRPRWEALGINFYRTAEIDWK